MVWFLRDLIGREANRRKADNKKEEKKKKEQAKAREEKNKNTQTYLTMVGFVVFRVVWPKAIEEKKRR